MYLDYILSKLETPSESEEKAAEYIDTLTFNRIDYDNLSDYQRRTVDKVHSRLTAFIDDNKELLESYLNEYSINGVSMKFGDSWNLKTVRGVALPYDLYSQLLSTGLCYPAI